MPFTPAHAAIVLPFLKIPSRYVSATGLVVGSLAPDFEYFLKMSVESNFSHTMAGIIYFDLPAVLFLSLVFHLAVKKKLIENLLPFFQQRFHTLYSLDFISYLKLHPVPFLVSSIVGISSHILWDSFTHADGYFVMELAFYNGKYIPFDGVQYPLWYALQHISTGAGLLILLLYFVFKREESTSDSLSKPGTGYWAIVGALTSLVVMIRFIAKPSDYNLGNLVVTSISGLCIALIVCGLIDLNRFTIKRI